ncbi:MAG: BamA/TamA family outer membrane protein [Chitinophagaceae bacterium]|nr:BamA/TamA family outer membrane protein [Chitinophagaceae bacterium]
MFKTGLFVLFLIYSLPIFSQQPLAPDSLHLSPLPQPKNLLAFPFVVRSLETDWGFGGIAARFFKMEKHDTSIRTSDVNLLALYTLKKQLIVVLNSTIFFPHENRIARFQASYSYFPDKFWGLGNHTHFEAEEPFTEKQYFINPQFLQRVHRKLYVGLTYEFQHSGAVDYIQGGLFDKQQITGRYGGNTSGIGPIVSWDTRNSAYSPDHGVFAEMQYVWFHRSLGSDFNFQVFSLDFRKFFHLSEKSVLALQGIAGLTSGNTPFRKLEELGGADMMRGYYAGRFTDKCLTAYQAEYRRLLFWRVGMVAFAATGEVSKDPKHFELDGFHYTYGGGLRFMLSKEEKLNLRVDYGMAKHSTAFNVQLREAF